VCRGRGPGEHHWQILRRLLELTGAAGNLTAAAHIAAIALERGAAVYSCEHDFARFPGLKHVDPPSEVLSSQRDGQRRLWFRCQT
jgi:predicted nucleic acid-binding protein